jgi:hypothetical protein
VQRTLIAACERRRAVVEKVSYEALLPDDWVDANGALLPLGPI